MMQLRVGRRSPDERTAPHSTRGTGRLHSGDEDPVRLRHHQKPSSWCNWFAGEPTRTNYTMSLASDDGATLRDPHLRCVAGPCHGWNAVQFVRLENDGRRAVASWDVWSQPTTWEITAEEVRRTEVSRFTRRVDIGTPFNVVTETGAPAPRITGRFPTGETFSFVVGHPTLNRRLRLLGFEV